MMPQEPVVISNPQCMAKALYDNVAESPDELAFRRGDLLTVLEQNTAGIEGWWLCSLRGRQGICPGNRLRLLAGVYDTGLTLPSDTPPELSTLQRQGKRRSWHVQPNKVLTPHRCGDVYLYDMPPGQARYDVPPTTHVSVVDGTGRDGSGEQYDVPRGTPVPASYDTPRSWRASPVRHDSTESYDVPRPLALLQHQQQLTPSSSASSLTELSLSGSNRSSLALTTDYDVPRSRQQPTQQLYDVPAPNPAPKELPLELGSAMETLARLQAEATAAVSRLLGHAGPQWRRRERLEPRLLDLKLAAVRLKASLHDLAEFGEGALGNAGRAPDKGLAGKLRPLTQALRDADTLVWEAVAALDAVDWALDVLARDEEEGGTDALDRLVACARALTEDVRQLASFIQGNGTLLFKRGSGTPPEGEWPEDYDYVNLESRENVARQHAEILEALPDELRKSYSAVVREAESTAVMGQLDPDDRQVLAFYATQTVTHAAHLTHAIDAFLQAVERNQPPRIFLAHSKFVVLAAHRLVHIGDTVHRNVVRAELRQRVLACANALSEALAQAVQKTKRAAQQFPSVTAVQEMVDSVVDISHLARDLKVSLVQAAQQP
ncbi:breast cancer anti-estrogen resistance protein 1 isoform X2 [Bacillus rossius redtenbacheri]|uniref:breast cancer anti-estrogen resistance protein 1 isoform X2 n=1 Tax=Bacillus rossius redtenbacheri TaxID=93214 RepID=UPI002FDEF68F